ncbi:MAG: carboxypeptidase-like regulatory domain-containing protein, partial [Planctomycetota bacterium]|nr:carboxypeptidase-like regulatory domain-containing protein [Planctomycetota bacterium]
MRIERPGHSENLVARDDDDGWKEFGVETTASDENGTFLLAVPADARLDVRVESELDAPFAVSDHDPASPLRVQLEPGREIRGTIFARGSGAPIGGATVRFEDSERKAFADGPFRETETDATGAFRLAGLGDSNGRLSAFAAAKAETRLDHEPSLPPAEGISAPPGETIYLDPGARFAGKVVDSEGRPIEGAELGLGPNDLSRGMSAMRKYGGGFNAKTDAEGAFRFEGLASGIKWAGKIRHDEYAASDLSIEVEIGRDVDDHVAKLGRGARVVWRYEVPEDEEIGKIELTVVRESGSWISRARERRRLAVESGEDGTYFVEKVPVGRVKLTWEPERWIRIEREEAVELSEGQTFDAGTLKLTPGRTLVGVVVDEDDEPIEGVNLIFRKPEDWLHARNSETSEDGAFEIRGLVEGALVAELRKKGFATREVDEIPDDGSSVRWVMTGLGLLEGEVALEDGGVPEKIDVRWFRETEEKGLRAMFAGMRPDHATDAEPDDEGLFEAEGFAPGDGALEIVAENYKPFRVEDVTLTAGEVLKLDPIVLERGLEVRGRVVDPEGSPVAGAIASVTKPTLFNIPNMDDDAGSQSDADGTFVVRGLNAGSAVLSVSHEEFSPFKQNLSLEDTDEPPQEVEVRLSRGGILTGQVRDEAGTPVPGAT